ncbi:MAG TPA: DUF2868 domain-containing protein [Burkholderiaceae bacterium]|nr:DUF2868 domain-containing protein [Burkholderiaceae bacterium]
MNESDARDALLVRAYETSAAEQAAWGADDRDSATRTAAAEVGERASADVFIATRSRLAAERLRARDPAARRAASALTWRSGIGAALAAAAFAAGAAFDAIGSGQRVNLLAPPLLALMVWNLAVYAAIAIRAVSAGPDAAAVRGPLAASFARIARRGIGAARDPAAPPSPLARFAADFGRASAPLTAARIALAFHLASIAFALGALAGMYVRGLLFEYRAGWESTFLDAGAVRVVLALVLGPASALTGIPLPDVAQIDAMRFPQAAGERAGAWIHLYAVTVVLVVVLPRLALAVAAQVRVRRLRSSFPLDLDDAYFGALSRAHHGRVARIVAVPYSHRLGAGAAAGLQRTVEAAFGPARLSLAPAVGYGDEAAAAGALAVASAAAGGDSADPNAAPMLVLAIVSSTATPEADAHGAFADALAAALPPRVPMLVLVDESAFVERFGTEDPAAARRRNERRQAWTRLLGAADRQPLFVDLERAEPQATARLLHDALDRLVQREAV